MLKKRFVRVVLLTVLILLVPFFLTQVDSNWDWNAFDFLVIGTLLLGAGMAYELIALRLKKRGYKILLLCATIASVLFVWAELAVGIFF